MCRQTALKTPREEDRVAYFRKMREAPALKHHSGNSATGSLRPVEMLGVRL